MLTYADRFDLYDAATARSVGSHAVAKKRRFVVALRPLLVYEALSY
jgi:hypothetical protein